MRQTIIIPYLKGGAKKIVFKRLNATADCLSYQTFIEKTRVIAKYDTIYMLQKVKNPLRSLHPADMYIGTKPSSFLCLFLVSHSVLIAPH